jgi:hypothetical protein
MLVLVTGLASHGKTRFVDALRQRLAPTTIPVYVSRGWPIPEDVAVLHVHAETDVEALVEGGLRWREADGAELVVAVDWEPVEQSVNRVVQTLATRGVPAAVGS